MRGEEWVWWLVGLGWAGLILTRVDGKVGFGTWKAGAVRVVVGVGLCSQILVVL